mmetsp:Transcript_13376/g.36892  ORF Transcript_13376/g.36892 Transcript_13376/m.36892 type:complete len:103 (+) Transcript_13376:383-691(+)
MKNLKKIFRAEMTAKNIAWKSIHTFQHESVITMAYSVNSNGKRHVTDDEGAGNNRKKEKSAVQRSTLDGFLAFKNKEKEQDDENDYSRNQNTKNNKKKTAIY